jgi:hypothetical protein
MWGRGDSQEVGLEAAILERVRNSSLVKRSCADNSTGLKPETEAAGDPSFGMGRGRGAFCRREKADRKDGWTGQKR